MSDALSPFASIAPALVANGYSPLPIRPDGKMPGVFTANGWRIMREWSRYCDEQPGDFQIRMWSKWQATNVGVALGRGVIAFDIDREEFVEPIKAVLLPAIVAKKGRKGETLFYRANTDAIRSRGFKIDGLGVMDLIAAGKQTVIPPSIHPDTFAPYHWTTERTLADTKPAELTFVTAEHFEAVLDVLRAGGWQDEKSHPALTVGAAGDIDDGAGAASEFFRQLNDDALRNLDAWVPRLGLTVCVKRGDQYRAVAEWRDSNSGKPTHKRDLHVSIHPKGIVDYGDAEKGYTPIDLVMTAFGCDFQRATEWLGSVLGYDFTPAIVLNRKSRPEGHVKPQSPGVDGVDAALASSQPASLRALPLPPLSPFHIDEDEDDFPPEHGEPWPAPLKLPPRAPVKLEVYGPLDRLPPNDLVLLAERYAGIAQAEADTGARTIFEVMGAACFLLADEQSRASVLLAPGAERDSYPVDMLGNVLGEAAKAIARKVQVPPETAAQSILAVASLAAQGIADVRLPFGQTRPLSLFALTIAQSSDRKSTADTEAMAPVRMREEQLRAVYEEKNRRYVAQAAAWRAQQEEVKRKKYTSVGLRAADLEALGPEPDAPIRPIIAIPDATHEGLVANMDWLPGALGLFSDEGARLLGGHGFTTENKAATAANLSSLWDRGETRRLRKGSGITDFRGRRVALHLMIQPSVAKRVAADPELRGQGLLARMLVAAPASMAGSRLWREPSESDKAAIAHYTARVLSVFEAHSDGNVLTPRILDLDLEARSAWIDFYDTMEAQQAEGGKLREVRDVAGKAGEQAARIAGVLTIIDDINATEIGGDAMVRACRLAAWYVNEAARIFAEAEKASDATEADVLREWLTKAGLLTVTLRQISREGPGVVRKAAVRKAAIETLEAAGYLIAEGKSRWKVAA